MPRAGRLPDATGTAPAGDGVRSPGRRTATAARRVLLMPTWSIVALAVLEGPGRLPGPALPGGHLRRPRQRRVRPAGRARRRTPTSEYAADTIAVLDAAGVDRAVLVGAVLRRRLRGARRRPTIPSGCAGSFAIAPACGFDVARPGSATSYVWDERATRTPRAGRSTTGTTGCEGGYADFRRVLLRRRCSREPHSTKQIEDCVGWALDVDPETAGRHAPPAGSAATARSARRSSRSARAVRCPVAGRARRRRPDPAARHRRAAGRADRRRR